MAVYIPGFMDLTELLSLGSGWVSQLLLNPTL
jgi:hypothetical protein